MPWRTDPESKRQSAATYTDPEYQKNRRLCLRRANGRCEQCGRRRHLAVDHKTPVSQGGTHTLANLQALCDGPGSCHARKTAQEGGGYRKPRAATDPDCTPRTAW